jgi:3-oxoacyl-[acyl-carrier-protein] synthase I
MITPIGANTKMTSAFVKASVSAYTISDYYNKHFKPIRIASVPQKVFTSLNADIVKSVNFNDTHERIIKMAIIAIREACESCQIQEAIPLILAMQETDSQINQISAAEFIKHLVKNCHPWIGSSMNRSIHSGRAAGVEALSFAFDYLYDTPNDFILIGGSDSYIDEERLNELDLQDRLLWEEGSDCFVPGEAAGFLLLTRKPELALVRDGHIIALHVPGVADEAGHLYSDEVYRGDGLAQAFRQALNHFKHAKIHNVYSSMNGEHYWAKEYGVALIRNQSAFHDPVKIMHPADCYGDLGVATAPILIALAAEDLWKTTIAQAHLVYSSSDTARRGAVVLEKIAVDDTTNKESKNDLETVAV